MKFSPLVPNRLGIEYFRIDIRVQSHRPELNRCFEFCTTTSFKVLPRINGLVRDVDRLNGGYVLTAAHF